jgi:hypothetical protein
MTPRRAFLAVLVATLALHLVTISVLDVWLRAPRVVGAAQWLICISASFAAARAGASLARTLAATAGGAMLATLLSMSVFVATGSAAALAFGPAAVYALLLGTGMISFAGGVIGFGAGVRGRTRVRAV